MVAVVRGKIGTHSSGEVLIDAPNRDIVVGEKVFACYSGSDHFESCVIDDMTPTGFVFLSKM